MRAWTTRFHEPGDEAWRERWLLDGELATVVAADGALDLASGPVAAGDAGHCVLWTRPSFAGDLRVSYRFTRLDANLDHVSVCILYLLASGVPPKPADIAAWSDERRVPRMHLYFDHMQCLHVSYACTGGPDQRYVRARRYPSRGNFDADTRVLPSYEDLDLFLPGEEWDCAFILADGRLEFTARRERQEHRFAWDLAALPALPAGRIGLRQMRGRTARYRDLRVATR